MTKDKKDTNQKLEQELAEAGLDGSVRTIDDIPENDIQCTSTSLPQLDLILHSKKLGLAEGRDLEIHSDDSEVGKTSVALQIASAWQRAGKRVAICDIAGTITTPYMQDRGLITVKSQLPEGACLPYWVETEAEGGGPKAAEEILGMLAGTSDKPGLVDIMDLIIVDDVPCLIQASDLEKDADEAQRTGGIAQHLTQHMRKTTHKRATVLWINQRREKMARGMPGMPPKKISMGGGAIPFWSSIRLTLSRVQKLEDSKKETYGMKVKFYTEKNKTSPPFKAVDLTYLDDEGFSSLYDYYTLAQKLGIITKSGNKIVYAKTGENIGPGEWSAYKNLRENPDTSAAIVADVNAKIHPTAM